MPKKEEVKDSKNKIKRSKIQKTENTNKILTENFIELQKIITEFSGKFEKLSNQLAELLNLFEESAKTLVRKEFEIVKENPNIELISKIDKILDQNKIIAKGLALIHEKPDRLQFNQQQGFYPQQQAYKEEMKKPIINKTEEKPKRPLSIEKDEEEPSLPVFEIP